VNAIVKKLLMKSGQHWLLFNAPAHYLDSLAPLPEGLQISHTPAGDFDGIQLFVQNTAQLIIALKQIQPVLRPDTVLWIAYPKKSSGLSTDLQMTSSWDEPARYGWHTVAAASIDQTWTALRFRPEGQSKVSATRNSELERSEHAPYVDVVNKIVKLPEEVDTLLQQHEAALQNFKKLSYSNKKEYALWILTAKQEKTKAERLSKMLEKLLAGKKNPSEK
jgi:hypothetical protein